MKSKIGTWIFLALAAIIVIVSIVFYANLGNDSQVKLILNLGYILLIAAMALAIFSAVFAAVVKGVNIKSLGIILASVAILAVIAYFMSKGTVDHFWVEFGLNFTYLTAGVSVIAILFSTIYKAVK